MPCTATRPSSGLGSNTSIQDSFNLAWKLAYVVRGWAREGLLSSYTAERAPVGRQVVERANQSRRDYAALSDLLAAQPDGTRPRIELIGDSSPDGARVRAALASAVERTNLEFNAHGVEINQRYRSGAVVPDGRDAAQDWPRDQTLYHQPSARPGAKLPHAWLVDGRGRRVSTLDLVGRGRFTLVTGLAGVVWADVVSALDLPHLDVLLIGSPGAQDLYFEWHRRREGPEGSALLVRPDGIIAWRCDEAEVTEGEARTKLASAIDMLLDGAMDTAPGAQRSSGSR
jgi:2,4-dichlorophenol 6-monooxygenase